MKVVLETDELLEIIARGVLVKLGLSGTYNFDITLKAKTENEKTVKGEAK